MEGRESFDDLVIPGSLFSETTLCSVNHSATNTKQLYHGRPSPRSQPYYLVKYQANPIIAIGQSDTDGGEVEDGITASIGIRS